VSFQYIDGIKYKVVHTDVWFDTGITGYDLNTEFIALHSNGWMVVYYGYCWDGPSGPMRDTKDLMYSSLGYDALYELLRKELLPQECREAADEAMDKWSKACGVSDFRAWYMDVGLEIGGAPAADPANRRRAKTAPTPS